MQRIGFIEVGKVLRVQKASPDKLDYSSLEKDGPLLSVEEQVLWSELQEVAASNFKEILAQGYAQHVIGPLLGSDHVDPGTLVCVSKEFLEALDQNIYKERPEWRIRASRINLQSGLALLMSNHASFSQGLDGAAPCISVEIKKVVVAVEMGCEKCKTRVLKTVAKIEGVVSMEVDASKNTVTVIGEVDPVKMTSKIRKFSRSAKITSSSTKKARGEKRSEKRDNSTA